MHTIHNGYLIHPPPPKSLSHLSTLLVLQALLHSLPQLLIIVIVVVVAAGNEGRLQNDSPIPDPSLDNEGYGTAYGSIQSPGNDPYVITVGAMKSMDGASTAAPRCSRRCSGKRGPPAPRGRMMRWTGAGAVKAEFLNTGSLS